MYRADDLWKKHAASLGLVLVAGASGLKRPILVPEAHRPGLGLAGFLKWYSRKRILVLGREEIEYLRELAPKECVERLALLLTSDTPAVIVTRRYRPPDALVRLSEENEIALFRTSLSTMNVLSKLTVLLGEEFAPSRSVHGTLVEVFGVGVLIQGDSAVGKSEAALGLVERGHRLVSDDVVRVRKSKENSLEGFGSEVTRHLMEIRGIGIIDVAQLYGAVCVREQKSIDLVARLVLWDETAHYDRLGLEEKHCDILSVPIPFHTLPVKPGRDVVLLLETIALNHRLRQMGLNSAQELRARQQEQMLQRRKKTDKNNL